MLKNLKDTASIPSYITPLFWQHGDREEVIRNEIKEMDLASIGGFIVESRPHPDFLSFGWWRDLDIIVDEAKKRDMKVWIFDDAAYPSGAAGYKLEKLYPDSQKRYMREAHLDTMGPLKNHFFAVDPWIEEGECLLSIIAARRTDGVDEIDYNSCIDLTDRVKNGRLYFDVPDGEWRIFYCIETSNGGEEHVRNYVNPIDKDAVRKFIDIIYEEHYKRYKDEFGKTIVGFFTDEPRFGNKAGYEFQIGTKDMVLPYCATLFNELSEEFGEDIRKYLPCLWYEAGDRTNDVRYAYMNVVSRMFGEHFLGQMGDWCRDHGVSLIGHVVEDNGSHARLGYGAGHFFRSLYGQDTSGFDVVGQVWPGYTKGRQQTPFGFLYCDFFYWGLAKMATSLAHIDGKKHGTTICEIFGAYGWLEGLKLMKWLTDHVCVRGTNHLVPHAVSPEYPDRDCPPHFYAQGNNPQWKYFNIWSTYSNRVCNLLSDGTHVASAAVLYHAQAEWGGVSQPFEKVVKILSQNQIDCDIIPSDAFIEWNLSTIQEGCFQINQETYETLIIPYAQYLPLEFAKYLIQLANNNIPIIFMRDYTKEFYYQDQSSNTNMFETLKENKNIHVCGDNELITFLREKEIQDIILPDSEDDLRFYHYIKNGENIYFFTNESVHDIIDTTITISGTNNYVFYDALENQFLDLEGIYEDGNVKFRLQLSPWESIFVLEEKSEAAEYVNTVKKNDPTQISYVKTLDNNWIIETTDSLSWPLYKNKLKNTELVNITSDDVLPDFAGTIRYTTSFEWETSDKKIFIDLGEVYEIADIHINGKQAGVRICPPYILEITDYLEQGTNEVIIEVTNTLSKKHGDNAFDRNVAQEPSGLMGPVRLGIL